MKNKTKIHILGWEWVGYPPKTIILDYVKLAEAKRIGIKQFGLKSEILILEVNEIGEVKRLAEKMPNKKNYHNL